MSDAEAFSSRATDGRPDPASVDAAVHGFAAALVKLGANVALRPWRALPAAARLTADVAAATARSTAMAVGLPARPVLEPARRDRRFTDPAWQVHPFFFGTGQVYLAWARFLRDLVDAGDLDEVTAAKARFAVEALVDAAAPTNLLPTNPEALRKAIGTRGASVLAGLRNVVADLASNGKPSQVDRSAFRLGENLAATPGQVVFRNDLMELIQYAPQTETVYETPLLLSPPWINKYYIMDLAPGRSFVEWAVRQGHTVFAISYRNPDESMRGVALDDYLLRGLGAAVDVVRAITGQDQVNVAGLCVGGTLAVAHLAYLAHGDDRPVQSVTLLNTLVDFSRPGALGVFTDPAAVARVERAMARRGYLDGPEMAATFDFLRANDLIWNYVGRGWLMGEPPPAFDILAWNADSTRVSAATHSQYLRSCYVENRLATGRMTLGGRLLDLDQVEADAYILAARDDHITPWKASYATTGLLPSRIRFVLSSSGHIAGIVNPPDGKRSYWTNDDLPEDPEEWLAGASEHAGSWWGDWAEWMAARAGERRPPPPSPGSPEYPPISDAPGTYVRSETP
jgi:polyhydroxyalkanoate synthase subunit PhaC